MELSQYLIETFKPVVTIIVEILTILLMNYSFAIENTDQRTMEMVRKMCFASVGNGISGCCY